MRNFRTSIRHLVRSRSGSIYIELAAAMLLLVAIFIGTAVIGSKAIDADRDGHGIRAGIDLAWLLDDEVTPPAQADIDRIGARVAEIISVGSTEEFEIIFTAVEFDHTGAGLTLDWQGKYGTGPGVSSRITVDASRVTVNGFDFEIADDERMIVVEIYRSRRGLFAQGTPEIYTKGIVFKADPDHA